MFAKITTCEFPFHLQIGADGYNSWAKLFRFATNICPLHAHMTFNLSYSLNFTFIHVCACLKYSNLTAASFSSVTLFSNLMFFYSFHYFFIHLYKIEWAESIFRHEIGPKTCSWFWHQNRKYSYFTVNNNNNAIAIVYIDIAIKQLSLFMFAAQFTINVIAHCIVNSIVGPENEWVETFISKDAGMIRSEF